MRPNYPHCVSAKFHNNNVEHVNFDKCSLFFHFCRKIMNPTLYQENVVSLFWNFFYHFGNVLVKVNGAANIYICISYIPTTSNTLEKHMNPNEKFK